MGNDTPKAVGGMAYVYPQEIGPAVAVGCLRVYSRRLGPIAGSMTSRRYDAGSCRQDWRFRYIWIAETPVELVSPFSVILCLIDFSIKAKMRLLVLKTSVLLLKTLKFRVDWLGKIK